MPINLGGTAISEIHLGDTPITRVHLGTVQVYARGAEGTEFSTRGFSTTGDTQLLVRLSIGMSARTNGNAAQIHLWTPSGSGFTPAVGEILEGSMTLTYGGATVDNYLRRIFMEGSVADSTRFGMNRSTGVASPNMNDIWSGDNDADRWTIIHKVTGDEDGFVMVTSAGHAPTSAQASFARWDRTGDANSRMDVDMADLLQSLSAGDEIIFALHTGTPSFQLSEPLPFNLASFEMPAGKQIASGPALIQAAAGTGDGGYTLGLWQRPTTDQGGFAGFGTLMDGDLEFTEGGFTDTFDEIKYQGATPVNNRWRFALSRWNQAENAHITNWMNGLTNPMFVLQTKNRQFQLPWTAATDRSSGANWVSWWLHGSGNANAMLTAEDITELTRVRTEEDLFIAAWVEDA